MAKRKRDDTFRIGRVVAGGAAAWRKHAAALAVLTILFAGLPCFAFEGLHLAYLGGALRGYMANSSSAHGYGSLPWLYTAISALISVVFVPALTVAGARVALGGQSGLWRTLQDALGAAWRAFPNVFVVELILTIPAMAIGLAPVGDNLAARWAQLLAVNGLAVLLNMMVGPTTGVFAAENPNAVAAIVRSMGLVAGHRWRFGLLALMIVVAATAAQMLAESAYVAVGLTSYAGIWTVIHIANRLVQGFASTISAAAYRELRSLQEHGRPSNVGEIFD